MSEKKKSIEPASEVLQDRLKGLQLDVLRISDELIFLNEIIKEMNKGLNIDEAMKKFLDGTVKFSRATGGAILIFQEERGVLRSYTIDFPQEDEFLCLLAEKADSRDVLTVENNKYLYEKLKKGIIITRAYHLLWNIRGVLVLYFKTDVPDLPEAMEILYETGFSALRNAFFFELTAKSQTMWQAVMDEVPDMIFVRDEEGYVIKCNMAFAKMLGLHPRDVVGKSLSQLPMRQEMHRCINDVLSYNENAFTKETRCNGGVFLVTSKKMILPDERQAYLFVVRDITAIRQLQEQLYHADKLASLGMLVSGVAHEINNPLTGIMGYTELLLMKVEDEALRRELEKIYHSAERCKKIVENLLAFSRQRPPQKAPVLLNDLIDGTLELRAYWLRSKNIKVIKNFQGQPYIKADPQQLQQVFLNLIINAEDALMASGKEDKKITVRTSYDPEKKTIIVEFEDNGAGIPEDILPRIFDPFFTTKPVGKGTGLGLSISHGIITEHGGSITVSSAPGEGTLFRIELPVEGTL